MHEQTFVRDRLALLPDSELLQLIDDVLSRTASASTRSMNREDKMRLVHHVEAISREIRARGLKNPPWWSTERNWDIEDVPLSARSFVGDVMFTT